ncbi:MAG: endonuclease Q family protein [Candidatus Kuenenbacteria bacterium]
MQYISDFHIHSKYSRATSKNMDLEGIDLWCKKKGIDVVTCADFTHPVWFKELKDKLIKTEDKGLYLLKSKYQNPNIKIDSNSQIQKLKPVKFILTTELSCIYKRYDKCRRMHLVVFAPDLETVGDINKELGKKYNLKSDGRPILGIDSEDLVKLLLKINPKIMVVPAHIWTPWFALFGSKSGFDSFEECFGEVTDKIFAIETGLSSDPLMNWLIPEIDSRTIISNSDAHSPDNLGREANVFEGNEINYNNIYDCLSHQGKGKKLELKYTIEFFPEEGKYHFDGHRDCKVVMHPKDSIKNKNICPKCKRELTIGVHHRVYELAKRKENADFSKRIPFKKIIPLREIIGNILEVGKKSKKVNEIYEKIIKLGENEFNVLLDFDLTKLKGEISDDIIKAIQLVREEKVKIDPGYDGEYGKIGVDLKKIKPAQNSLF